MSNDILLLTDEDKVKAYEDSKKAIAGKQQSTEPVDLIALSNRHWQDYFAENDLALDKAATAYAFVKGEQNIYLNGRQRVVIDAVAYANQSVKVKDCFNQLNDYMLQWAAVNKAAFPIYRCEPVDPSDSTAVETARLIEGVHRYHSDYVWRMDILATSKILPGIFKGAQVYNLWYAGVPDDKPSAGEQPKRVVKNLILSAFQVNPIGRYETSLSECGAVQVEVQLPVRAYCEMFPDSAEELRTWVKDNNVDHSGRWTKENEYLANYDVAGPRPVRGFTINDRELIARIIYLKPDNSPLSQWPKGKQVLIIDNEVRAQADLIGGVMPVEVWSTICKDSNNAVRTSPAYEGVSSQILINDLTNALRKKAHRDANRPVVELEGTKINKLGTDGQGSQDHWVFTPDIKKLQMGTSAKEQLPFELPATGAGIAPEIWKLGKSTLQTTMHVNAELGNAQPQSGVPGVVYEDIAALSREKMTPGQQLLEASIFRSYLVAAQMMQEILEPGDTFAICDGDVVDTYTWKKTSITGGLNHTFTSRIGVPTTKEAKLKWAAGVSQATGVPLGQTLSKEEYEELIDTNGMGIRAGRDPEFALAEAINRKIQSGQIEKKTETNKLTGQKINHYIIKGIQLRPEWDCKKHLHILSKLFVGKQWASLSEAQQEAAQDHAQYLILQQKLKENNLAGLFGGLPPAELDIMMWHSVGLDIPPEVQDYMKKMGMTYHEYIAEQAQIAMRQNGTEQPPKAGPQNGQPTPQGAGQ